MKMRLILAVFALGLSACAPLSIYHRPGVSVPQMQMDRTECEVSALRDAPVATRIRQNPPIFEPPRQFCNARGDCVIRPGYWRQGAVYTEDVNLGLRSRLQNICMGKRGYQQVTLPRCSATVAAAAPRTPTRTLPALAPESCAIRYDDGSWQIVTPVPPQQ
ncbi:hypothetical protein [Pontibaca salina]|uniref:Lipoprotein n=1 Tax=Pontibaca salina TaxID=2795731 RepID=A0A934HNW9_9RHOB|nr:hypothetical protein [Pontibaca salina]MBI6629042.1 hypothetical protein [Pontibaca salina]